MKRWDDRDPIHFTETELDVMRLVGEQMTYRQIALSLGWSPHTVHAYVRRIADKLPASPLPAKSRVIAYLSRAA